MRNDKENIIVKDDFIHKMKIAAKEADEVEYFLLLCKFSKTYPFQQELLDKFKDIQNILSKIISTFKGKN